MAVPTYNLTIHQSEDFTNIFTFTNSDQSITDLSNRTVVSTLKKHSQASVGYAFSSFIDETNGKIYVSLGSTITEDLTPGRYYYDVFTITSDSKKEKRAEGSIIVKGSASFWRVETYYII